MRTAAASRKDASLAIARLIPNIMRGIQLDLFVRRGVTQTQFLVLVATRAFGRCTMGQLARSLHVTMPTISGIVSRLVDSGHLRRAPQAEDRRQVVVELTPKGQAFFQAFERIVRQRWEEVLRSLEPDELTAFHHVVTKLHERLQPLSD
jgi:DNA-binding MarR family transcriptional regulator